MPQSVRDWNSGQQNSVQLEDDSVVNLEDVDEVNVSLAFNGRSTWIKDLLTNVLDFHIWLGCPLLLTSI